MTFKRTTRTEFDRTLTSIDDLPPINSIFLTTFANVQRFIGVGKALSQVTHSHFRAFNSLIHETQLATPAGKVIIGLVEVIALVRLQSSWSESTPIPPLRNATVTSSAANQSPAYYKLSVTPARSLQTGTTASTTHIARTRLKSTNTCFQQCIDASTLLLRCRQSNLVSVPSYGVSWWLIVFISCKPARLRRRDQEASRAAWARHGAS